MKNFAKTIFLLFGLLALSGIANAATRVAATGGGAIASNTAPGCSATGTWAALTGPSITEQNPGEVGLGDIVLTAPAGFEFNTAAAVTILLAGSNTNTRNINGIVNGTSVAVTSVSASAITFTVISTSARVNTLTWQGIQVRPTASAPLATGNITDTGSSPITGLNATTNFGTLTEVASVPVCNPSAPTVTTNAATTLTTTGATLNGTVSSNNASTTVTFDYGLTTGYGSTATASASPLAFNAANTAVSAAVSGLTCATTYHFRVKGVNSAGTSNGSDATFATSACPLPVVVLGKTAGTSAATVNSYVTFNLLATNPTAAALTNVVLTDVIPIGMTYITNAPTLGTASVAGQTLTWNIPYLPAGGSAQLTLVVQPTVKGSYTNTVTSPGATDASASILILPTAITRYSMDETAGSWTGATGEVIDSGGNALSGHRRTTTTPTATNTVAPSPTIASQHASVVGGFCNAGRFDGNAVVESASSTFFQFSNQLSASAWIYPTAYPTGGSDLYSILSNDVNYEFHLNPAGQLYWWWQASTLTSAATIPLNTWTHIAITFDSTAANRRQRIYINGVQDANTNNWTGTLATNTCPFYIGGDISTGSGCTLLPARNFHGMIDEAKIYNYELSAAEVNADMNLGRLCGTSSFDHIQIEHDGTASTCAPKTVTVKACMNASCSSLYPGTVTVHLSPTGWIPGDILTINGGAATATLNNSSISAPNVTLGTTSVTPTPANVTTCFNGSTSSCTLSVGATSCSFDAAEVAANPQTQLYTKLAGTAFNVDVLAVGSPNTTVDITKNSTVSVDIVDASSAICSATSTALNTAQPVTLVSGRKTVTMTCATAVPSAQVRIRIGSTAPYSYACSHDKFAVRPSAVTLTTTNANAAAPGSAATPTIKAGLPFNIGASTAPNNYTGVLTLDASKMTAQLPSNGATQQDGGTVGILAPSPDVQANTSQGNNATYSEVGYFYAKAGTFRDTNFTSVDQIGQPAGCFIPNTTDTCDCLLSTNATNIGVPDNLSDVLVNGRYGCYVGNKTAFSFGRFIPEHFDTSVNAVSGVPMPCPAGQTCPVSYNGFVYSGQAFTTQVMPKNLAGGTTKNYYSNFAKNVTLSAWDAQGSTTVPLGALSNTSVPASAFDTTCPKLPSGFEVACALASMPTYILPTQATAPTNIYLRATEASGGDGVTSLRATNPTTTSVEGGVKVVVGRMKVSNAYGSELLPLPLVATVQYWNGAGWLTSTTDSMTSFNTGTNLVANIVKGPLTLGRVSVANAGVATVTNGIKAFKLNAPGTGFSGSADISLGGAGAPSYLLTGSNGAAVNPSVAGRVTFGVYKGANQFIYQRELY
jgi:uncharacterized repeat protein (TIGR01451 family)